MWTAFTTSRSAIDANSGPKSRRTVLKAVSASNWAKRKDRDFVDISNKGSEVRLTRKLGSVIEPEGDEEGV